MVFAIVGCGLMGGALASLVSAQAELILIDRNEAQARGLAEQTRGRWATDLQAAQEAGIVAVLLPANAIEETFTRLADIVKPGAVVLDMATKGSIPQEARLARPDACFVEAKIVGSAIGVSLGLPALLVIDPAQEGLLSRLRDALPGFGDILSGDTRLVRQVNARGAYWGIRAAVEAEEELRRMGLPEAWRKAAAGCLVPGSTVGFSKGRMGKFNRDIAEKLLSEIRAGDER